MTISDIITLLSLVIAIVAILSDKNRRHLLLKFHIVDYLIFFVSFFLINYFVFYENFYNKGIFITKLYFDDFGLNNPKHYAYLIAILSLVYFFYKILYSFYPNSKLKSVITFYKQLIENNEISFLLELIDRYHRADIIKLIQKSPDYDPDDNWWRHRFHRESVKEKIGRWFTKTVEFLFPFSWYNRRAFGVSILHNIVNDPAFIVLASNQRPYLLTEIFAEFKEVKRDAFPKELINSFLTELLQHKNFWLKKELMQSQNHDYGQPEWFHGDNKIISSLISDLTVADVNEIWRPFGEAACEEIEEERTKGYDSKMFHEFRDEQFLWEYKTYFTIQFLKILIIEAIIKKYDKSHFWLFYYRSITDTILKTFEKFPPSDFESTESVYHKFIKLMIDNIFLWLDISNDKINQNFHGNIIDCLGSIVHSVCKSQYYGEKRKVELIDRIFTKYCRLENNTETENMREELEAILLRPCMLTEPGHPYYYYVETAWTKFDKIPHRTMSGLGNDLNYFTRIKDKVIKPLGLDPDLMF